MDGTWRIDRQTSSKITFISILENKEAHKLYDGIYTTKQMAYDAMIETYKLLGISPWK
jgi:hypothetical protein